MVGFQVPMSSLLCLCSSGCWFLQRAVSTGGLNEVRYRKGLVGVAVEA